MMLYNTECSAAGAFVEEKPDQHDVIQHCNNTASLATGAFIEEKKLISLMLCNTGC